jgi:hypothetical protein
MVNSQTHFSPMGRRRHERYAAYVSVTLADLTEREPPVTGFIANVSQQGVRVMTPIALDIGQPVKLHTDNRTWVGDVVYSNAEGDSFCTGVQLRVEPLVRRTVSRHHLRYPASGTLRVLWRTNDGDERISNAKMIDASEKGIRLRLDEMIPVRSHVSLSDEGHGVDGTASVRYCRFVNGDYDAGLEFAS